MSDMAVVEITPPKVAKPALPAPTSSTQGKPLSKANSRWVRTRQCWCPKTAETDCRFHSPEERGWLTCPWEKKGGQGEERWLWGANGTPVSDEDLSVGANIKELTTAQQHAGDRLLN